MTGLIIIVNYDQEIEIGRFLKVLSGVNTGLDAVVIDDGSHDRSPDIASEHGYRVIRHVTNQGVGAAIRSGIKYAMQEGRYDYVVIMSSNGKMLPKEIPLVIRPILDDHADYVQGSRFMQGGRALSLSTFRSLGIPAYSLLASILLKRRFTDITCGFRAYRLWLLKDQRVNLNQPWLNQYEAELYIHYYACRLKARIVEVPVTIDYSHLSPGRKSKMIPVLGWWSLFRPLLLLSSGLKR
jgi:dolichol-phosphate mannosyltransferase